MRDARRVGAFFSGVLLYCVAMAVAFMLADVHLPRELAAVFGGRATLGALAVEASLIAVLLFVVSLFWSYFTVTPGRKSRHRTTSWFLSGLGSSWLSWLIWGVFDFALNPRRYQTMSSLLLASATPPLWGVLNILAVVAGAVLADRVARKRFPKSSRSYGSSSASRGVSSPERSASTA